MVKLIISILEVLLKIIRLSLLHDILKINDSNCRQNFWLVTALDLFNCQLLQEFFEK